jgi:hypothetical protein
MYQDQYRLKNENGDRPHGTIRGEHHVSDPKDSPSRTCLRSHLHFVLDLACVTRRR